MGRLSALLKKLHGPVYESRLRELVRRVVPHLRDGDHVLDVGCGGGAQGRAILKSPDCPPGVNILGLEAVRRGSEAIPVQEYDGRTIPFPDGSFDVVLLADVLHHEADPHRLIAECVRVSRRHVIIKDHKIDGPLAWPRIALMDWAANAPYGVPCLYRYNTLRQWEALRRAHGLEIEEELRQMRLYPQPYDAVFGGRLQYLAVLRVDGNRTQPVQAA